MPGIYLWPLSSFPGLSSLFKAEEYLIMCIFCILFSFSTSTHLCCFHLLASVKSIPVKGVAYIFLEVPVFIPLGIPRNGIVHHIYGKFYFYLFKELLLFSTVGAYFIFQLTVYSSSSFSTCLPAVILFYFDSRYPNERCRFLITSCILICLFFERWDVENHLGGDLINLDIWPHLPVYVCVVYAHVCTHACVSVLAVLRACF